MPPGLPSGARPAARPAPWALGLLGPCDARDLPTSLLRYCERHGDSASLRDLRHYARHGRPFAPPAALHELKPEQAAALVAALARARPKPGDAYMNSLLLALALPGARYCEGLAADASVPFPRQHAWVCHEGRTIDPADFLDAPLRPGPRAAYFGVELAPEDAAAVMLAEGCARPVALGPPRPLAQRAIEDGLVGLS